MNNKKPVRVNLFLDPQILKAARMKSAEEGLALSKFVEKSLSSYMPTVISVVNPRENITPIFQAKIDQAQQLVADINVGTAPMNSLPATVTQKMAEGLKYQDDRKT